MEMDAFVENLNHVMDIKNGDYIVDNKELIDVIDFWITNRSGGAIIYSGLSKEEDNKRLMESMEANEHFRECLIKLYKQKKIIPDALKVCLWEGRENLLFGICSAYEVFFFLQKIQTRENKKFECTFLEDNEKVLSFFQPAFEKVSEFFKNERNKKRKKKRS